MNKKKYIIPLLFLLTIIISCTSKLPSYEDLGFREGGFIHGDSKFYFYDTVFGHDLTVLGYGKYDDKEDSYYIDTNDSNLDNLTIIDFDKRSSIMASPRYQFSKNKIKDIRGIEYFKNLEVLKLLANEVTALNIEKNLELKEINLFNNLVGPDINLTILKKLEIFRYNNTGLDQRINSLERLNNLDITGCTVLRILELENNMIETDGNIKGIETCTNLIRLKLDRNPFDSPIEIEIPSNIYNQLDLGESNGIKQK